MAIKRKSVKKVSLDEFRAWLEGVEEMQANDWHPNAEQWKTIRNKINNIKPDVIKQEVFVAPKAMRPPEPTMAEPIYEQPASLLEIPVNTPAPVMSGEGTPQRIKTPNIDTADGNYVSSFT